MYFDGLTSFHPGDRVQIRGDVLTDANPPISPCRYVERCTGCVTHQNNNLIEVAWETGFTGSVPAGHLVRVQ